MLSPDTGVVVGNSDCHAGTSRNRQSPTHAGPLKLLCAPHTVEASMPPTVLRVFLWDGAHWCARTAAGIDPQVPYRVVGVSLQGGGIVLTLDTAEGGVMDVHAVNSTAPAVLAAGEDGGGLSAGDNAEAL